MSTPDSMPQRHNHAELLTVEQFAKRMFMSRATVFTWVQRGILVKGKHFLKYGRVVRFLWSDNTPELLVIDSKNNDPEPTTRSAPRAQQAKRKPVNWDY